MTMTPTLTPGQTAIRDAAARLTAALDANVPATTIHYAVEDARRAAAALTRLAHSVVTTDVKARRTERPTYPAADLDACLAAGMHVITQRHPLDDCPQRHRPSQP